ncbi:Serine/threonine-protein kinase CTR1 [Acorus calamus]|uniref:Serine/threonine-protein kinase CTR1 n=1 Tax=Acorus calamus TaxID=4465 RepID=A0AAV9CFR5_ACOCL|nr:Serine/threonine-protein kinase CTR1 [Acorus calamus]
MTHALHEPHDDKPTDQHGCCGGLSVLHSITPQSGPLSTPELKQQKEVQRQKDMKIYKGWLERVQDYLRCCLKKAKENGFLDLINNHHNNPHSESNPQTRPNQLPTLLSNQSLEIIRHQAKINGWYIEPNEIELHEHIGKGSTADIYRATWRGLNVAVKWIFPDIFNSDENGVIWFAQELEVLSHQHHPFVLQLMGACLELPTNGWIVTELLSGKTLTEWLHGCKERRKERMIPLPPLEERLKKGLEIALAMQYLHEKTPKVVHRDLKPSNIFLDDGMHVRVADFGHARFLLDEEQALTGETVGIKD